MGKDGKLVYTERAFEQDADQAMGADIVRALVELVTNADDAYGSQPGPIDITVTRAKDKPVKVAVRDAAKGLTGDELESCFGVLGGQSSGFHDGQKVRGLLGRGAKDTAAFGQVAFSTIKANTFATFVLKRNGTYSLSDEVPATDDNRARLRLDSDANGLLAEVTVMKQGVNVPRLDELTEKIATHVQLRDITTRREVTIHESVNGGPTRSRVARWIEPTGTEVINEQITVGEFGVDATLRITRLNEPSAGQCNSHSNHGIVVKGAAAAFSNEFFGESAPETQWVHGELVCEHIDQLIRDYDTHGGADKANPNRLLRRDRDGLAVDHPFYKALRSAVLLRIADLLAELRPQKSNIAAGEALQKDLNRAREALGSMFDDDLKRLDNDMSAGGLQVNPDVPIKLIPNRVSVPVGKTRTITVLASTSIQTQLASLQVTVNNTAVIAAGELSEFTPHPTFDDTLIGRFTIEGVDLGATRVAVRVPDDSVSSACDVLVVEMSERVVLPPDALEFANESMSVTVGKTRTVLLRAPAELAAKDMTVTVTIDGETCELIDDAVDMALIADGWLEGRVRVSGIAIGEACTLHATWKGQVASGTLRATKPVGLFGDDLDFVVLDREHGPLLGFVRSTGSGHLVEIHGKHASIAPILGNYTKTGWANEDTPQAKFAVFNAIASVIADWIVKEDAKRAAYKYPDVDAVVPERERVYTRYAARLVHLVNVTA